MDSKTLIEKAKRVFREEGAGMLLRKTRLYIKNYMGGQRIYSDRELVQHCYMDVLFINGCYLDHPSRYRVTHQREQLQAANITTAEISYQDISLEYVKNFRMFIFFRCPYTDAVGEFVKKAKAYNKTVLYDIDDLVIDKRYTDGIAYVQAMSEKDRTIYDNGVMANGKLLAMCDGAITTTETLAEELKHYVADVMINRNVASERMIELSDEAVEKRQAEKKKKGDNPGNEEKDNRKGENSSAGEVRIGYFSGSITHNPDFAIVLSALLRLLETYPQVKLLLAGELDLPEALAPYQARVEMVRPVNWQKLPDLIASVDINLAPLEDTLFNRAKSENKWTEASLVKVVTAASDVGAFQTMIEDGRTGVLCENTEQDWYEKLERLICNPAFRERLAENAYQYVRRNCTTVYTAVKFADQITERMRRNIVFILPVIQISGGGLVTLKHAAMLQKQGYDVTIFNDGYEKETELVQEERLLPVISRRDIEIRAMIDRCVATLWSTTDFFDTYGKIRERYYLIQNYETDFYQPGNVLRVRANQSYRLRMPVHHITISRWCQNWLRDDYGIAAKYAPNGLDTGRFYPCERDYTGKIRILVEGNSDDFYKNVDESFRIVDQLDPDRYEIWFMSYQGKPKDWYRVDRFLHKVPYTEVPDVYRQCHILIKSSRLESFSYPPLEMMATGGCVVVAPNGGNVEYLRDGENCLFYRPGEPEDAATQIAKIVSDCELRKRLIRGGIRTGEERNWDQIEKQILELYES